MEMIDYKISQNGDIILQNGDFVIVRNIDSLLQRIKQKFSLWEKEWVFDENAGFSWMDVLGKRPNPDVLRSLVRDVIESDEDVRAVTELDLENTPERKLKISFTARTILSSDPVSMEMIL